MALNEDLVSFINQANEGAGIPVFREDTLEKQFLALGLEPESVTSQDLRVLQPIISDRIDEREAAFGTIPKDQGTIQGTTPVANIDNAVLRPLTQDEIQGTSARLALSQETPTESPELRPDERSAQPDSRVVGRLREAVSSVIPPAQADGVTATVNDVGDVTSEDFKLRLKEVLSRGNIEGKEGDRSTFVSAVKAVVNDRIKSAKSEEDKFTVRLEAERFLGELNQSDNKIRTANQFFASIDNQEDLATIRNLAASTANAFVSSFTETAAGLAGLAGFDEFADSARELANRQREFFEADDEATATQVGNAIGSILSFLVPGGALKVVGAAGKLGRASKVAGSTPAAALTAGGQLGGYQASDLRRDYEATVLARGEEVDEELADRVEQLGALLAIPEVIGPTLILRHIGGPAVDSIFKTAAFEGATEGGFATVTDLARNYIASGILKYDPDRDVFSNGAFIESLKEGGIEGAAGTTVSAAVSLIANAFNKRGVKFNQTEVNQNGNQENSQESAIQEEGDAQGAAESEQGSRSQQEGGSESDQVQGEAETITGSVTQPLFDPDDIRNIRQPSPSQTSRQQQVTQAVRPAVSGVVNSNFNNGSTVQGYATLPDTFKRNFQQARTPDEQLDLINQSINRANETVDTATTRAAFLQSKDSNTLADSTTSSTVFFQTKNNQLADTVIESINSEPKRTNPLRVVDSPDLDKANSNNQIIIGFDASLVNGTSNNDGSLTVNKLTPEAIKTISVKDIDQFNILKQNKDVTDNFDVNSPVMGEDGRLTITRKSQIGSSLLYTPDDIPVLESIRQQLQLSPTDSEIVENFSQFQRVVQGIPANNPTITDTISFNVIKALRKNGGVPIQISRPLEISRESALANSNRINQLNDQLFKHVTKQNRIINNIPYFGNANRVANTVNKFETDIFSNANNTKDITKYDAKLQLVNLAVRGDTQALSQLDKRSRKLVGLLRTELDNLSIELVNTGFLAKPLADAIGDNVGKYLLRSYKVFRPEEKWNYTTIRRDNPEIYDGAIKVISQTLSSENAKPDPRFSSFREEADSVVREMTDLARASGVIYGTTRAGRADIRSFIKRKDIVPEIRALLGEDLNPFVSVKATADRTAKTYATYSAQRAVRETAIASGLFTEKPDHKSRRFVRVFSEKNEFGAEVTRPQFAGFGEVYTTPELADAMNAMSDQFNADRNPIKNILPFITGLGKINQVILSPQAYSTNFIGAGSMELLNGRLLFNNKGAASSLKSLNPFDTFSNIKGTTKLDKFYTSSKRDSLYSQTPSSINTSKVSPFSKEAIIGELRSAGLLDVSVFGSDVTETLEKSGSNIISRGLRKLVKAPSRLYQVPDNAAKINAYVVELDKHMRASPDVDMQTLIERATQDVRDTTQNYDLVPNILKVLSQNGVFIPTYVGFSAELIRTTVNTARLTAREIKSPNPVIRASGYRRAAGFGVATMLSAGLSSAVTSMFGPESEDAAEALKAEIKPPWLTGKDIAIASFDGKTAKWFDPNYIFPHVAFSNVFKQVLMNPDDSDMGVFARGFTSLMDNFGGTNIATNVVSEVMSNRDANGRPIWNEEEAKLDSNVPFVKATEHIFNSMYKSGFQRLYENINKADTGDIGYMGSFRTRDDLYLSLIGLRLFSVDVSSAFKTINRNILFEMNAAKRNAPKERNPEFLSQEEFDRRTQVENTRIKQVQDRYGEFIDNARATGIPEKTLRSYADSAPREILSVLKQKGVISMTNDDVTSLKRRLKNPTITALSNGQVRELFKKIPDELDIILQQDTEARNTKKEINEALKESGSTFRIN